MEPACALPLLRSVVSVTATSVYETRAINTVVRKRRTNAELDDVKSEIFSIAKANQPCSSRSIYYIGIGRLWEKDVNKKRTVYQRVNRWIGEMRENGELPWPWITDSTRLVRIPNMYDSYEEALRETAAFYRRDLWSRQPLRLEVWCESDSVGAMLHPVTSTMGVGLFSCRGQAGKGFVHESVQDWRRSGKPVTILYVGDWDPSGHAIPRSLEERLRRYSNDEIEIDFQRFAVTPEQIIEYGLQTHDVNTADRNYRRFAADCALVGLAPQDAVEVESMPPLVLRGLLERALLELVEDADSWNATIAAEESEREILRNMTFGGAT